MVCGRAHKKGHENHFCIPNRATIKDIEKQEVRVITNGCRKLTIPVNHEACKECEHGGCGFEPIETVIKPIGGK